MDNLAKCIGTIWQEVVSSIIGVTIPLDRFIVNGDAAILVAKNGRKAIVKLHSDDEYDATIAFLRCYLLLTSTLSKNKANKILKTISKLDGRENPAVIIFADSGGKDK